MHLPRYIERRQQALDGQRLSNARLFTLRWVHSRDWKTFSLLLWALLVFQLLSLKILKDTVASALSTSALM